LFFNLMRLSIKYYKQLGKRFWIFFTFFSHFQSDYFLSVGFSLNSWIMRMWYQQRWECSATQWILCILLGNRLAFSTRTSRCYQQWHSCCWNWTESNHCFLGGSKHSNCQFCQTCFSSW
jgi:hypothetical protein